MARLISRKDLETHWAQHGPCWVGRVRTAAGAEYFCIGDSEYDVNNWCDTYATALAASSASGQHPASDSAKETS